MPVEEQNNPNFPQPGAHLAFVMNEGLKRKGLTLKKLSDTTGIAFKHLEKMTNGHLEQLPAAPYLRSYLIVCGRVLGFDGLALWEQIKSQDTTLTAGDEDRLPLNRFTSLRSFPKKIVAGVLGVLVLIIFLWRLPYIIGQPSLEFGFPKESPVNVALSPIIVHGFLENGDELVINDEPVVVNETGFWQKSVTLDSGLNTLEFKAKKFLGREIKETRQIIYTGTEEPVEEPTDQPEEENPTSTEEVSE